MALNSSTFRGKTVMLTGCNRGIGLCAARLFASSGANLICCVRRTSQEFLAQMEELKRKYLIEFEIINFDLLDEESIKSALKPLFVQKREIDVLVNNAGVAAGGMLHMTSMKQLKEVFQVNFFSQVLITQIVSKLMMKKKSGSIVNLGSVAGMDNFAGYTSYGSSKAAIMFFTKTIAKELAPYNIRVNAVAPGLTDTGMADQMETKAWENMVDRTDMKRLGKAQEIAEAIVWLASEEASFITGQTIRVDGGM